VVFAPVSMWQVSFSVRAAATWLSLALGDRQLYSGSVSTDNYKLPRSFSLARKQLAKMHPAEVPEKGQRKHP